MARLSSKQLKIVAFGAGFFLLAMLSILLFRDTDETGQPSSSAGSESVRGFTFLDLHAGSILTEKMRNRLTETLGSEAVEHRTVLDLEMHYPGFLEKHFPDLSELNRRLNYEAGRRVRIEHDTVKLIYRYSTPFDYVELVFSNLSRKPLLIRIRARGEGVDYLAAIQQKYAEPTIVPWENGKGKSLLWRMHKDAFLFSIFNNQYGEPRFEIMICHTENIENLLAAEKKETLRKSQEDGAGRPLF